MILNMILQKIVYQMLLSGFPNIVYNPISKNPFQSKFTVDTNSLYINYILNDDAISEIEKNIGEDLILEPISLEKDKNKKYFLSINMYNVTSPILNTKNTVTRCEVNTYVKRKSDNKKGTIILDYTSNSLSMDPVNIFKARSFSTHYINNDNEMDITSISENFHIFGRIGIDNSDSKFVTNRDLHKFTDNVFYRNGIYDKIYYDSSLTHCNTLKPKHSKITFKLYNQEYINPDSIFYFEKPICFSGEMWSNIFE